MNDDDVNRGPDQIGRSSAFTATDISKSVKLRLESDDDEPISVPTLLKRAAEKAAEKVAAMSVKRDGSWIKWTFKEYFDEVQCAANAFIQLGLGRRRSVAVCGFNSPEWFISDLAAIHAGGIAVGLYPTNSAETCKFVLKDCEANIAVVEDDKQLRKMLEIRRDLPDLKAVVQYIGKPKRGEDDKEFILSWKELLQLGRSAEKDELSRRLKVCNAYFYTYRVFQQFTFSPVSRILIPILENAINTPECCFKK